MVTLSLKYFFDARVTALFKMSSIREMTIKDDQIIINQILEGNPQAFSLLVDRYKNLVFNLTLRMMKHQEEAEEVAQDVFIKVVKSLPKFKGDAKLSTWIYKIAYNACLDALKKSSRKYQEISIDKYEGYDISVIDNAFEKLAKEEREDAIKWCIQQLSSEDSSILSLYYFEELSLDEISKVIGLKPNNIKVKLHRARKRLAVVMKQRLEPEIIADYGN
ncbi:MAG: RNA polymerase sigma factor [Jejuia sp.]